MSATIIPSKLTYFRRPGNTLTLVAWEDAKLANPRPEYTCETCWHIHDGMLKRNKPLSDVDVTKRVLIRAGIYFTGELDCIKITSDLHGKTILVIDYEDDNLVFQLEAAGAKVVYITSNTNYNKQTPELYFKMYPGTYDVEDYPAEDKRRLYEGKNVTVHYVSFFNYLQTLNNILKEYRHMKFDLVISNPPYGPIGANISKTIINKVSYKQFINLLPAPDYKRNKDKDLFRYARNIEAINNGFADATVTTHIAEIVKTPSDISLDEFERSTYLIKELDKYFEENFKRQHYAIDNTVYKPKLATFDSVDLTKTLYLGKRTPSAGELVAKKSSPEYRVNVLQDISNAELIAVSAKSEQALGNVGDFTITEFATAEEKQHMVETIYDVCADLFRAILVSINKDSYFNPKYFLPKVDYTKSWTTETLLADYGYTAEEIAHIKKIIKGIKKVKKAKKTK